MPFVLDVLCSQLYLDWFASFEYNLAAMTMRKPTLLILLVFLALPAFAVKHLSVQQLDQTLTVLNNKPD
jgi:hypothetical protein